MIAAETQQPNLLLLNDSTNLIGLICRVNMAIGKALHFNTTVYLHVHAGDLGGILEYWWCVLLYCVFWTFGDIFDVFCLSVVFVGWVWAEQLRAGAQVTWLIRDEEGEPVVGSFSQTGSEDNR